MTNTRKTKAEMLQELESIKGLLLDNEDIPILQLEDDEILLIHEPERPSNPSALPGQGSLFDDAPSTANKTVPGTRGIPPINIPPNKLTTGGTNNRPPVKPSGENPFLPQHIRQRLHGNNPPPLFEYETAQKIASVAKQFQGKTNTPRQRLVEDVIAGLMPQIETELRHRLFAMSTDELEQLLLNSED